MTLQRNATDAPHLGRTVLVAPNRRVNLAAAGHPLATIKPQTPLGAVALKLAMQSSSATIQIVATSTYVNALTALAAPVPTFTAPPPGTQGITVQQLQDAYDSFVAQLAALQGQASTWIATSGGSGGASIFSNLVTVASTLQNINSQVQTNFTLLNALPPGSAQWQATKNQQVALIGAEANPLTSLESQLNQLSSSLSTAASTLIDAAGTGVLAQLQTAYQDEINALNQDISNANATISSDNSKIIGLGFAAGAAIVVGIIGLVNIWNPIGWIMLAGGAAGAYFAIAEIEALKGEIALLKQKIQTDTAKASDDRAAAQTVATFASSAQDAAALNSASQQEINSLLELCTTLGADIATALQETDQNDFADALNEWNEIVAAAAFLGGITAYIWPSSIQLANPTSLTARGDALWLVSNSGAVFQYTTGGNTWTALPDYSLSAMAAGADSSRGLYAIDGAPADGSQVQPNTYGQSFNVKVYPQSTGAWQTLSGFAVAQIATDGTNLWAVKQAVNDRQAYAFAGATSWTPVGSMPNSDAPGDIAACDGTLFAIAINGGGLWYAGSSGWTQIGTATYSKLNANGAFLGLLDPSGAVWVIDASTAGSYTPVFMGSGTSVLAQAPSGDQYVVDQYLNLWHIVYTPGGTPASTQVRTSTVSVTVSDGGTVYALDNAGNAWVQTNASSNSWQQLPALPTGG